MFDFRERLKVLMEERGMNIHSLAKKSGLSWNTIKNFFVRDTKPTVMTVSMLCDGLGITLAQFFDVEGGHSYLTEQQQRVIDLWNVMSDREKKSVLEIMDIIAARHRQENGDM